MLPDISDFTLLGSELKQGQECQKWQKKEVIGQKVSEELYFDWLDSGGSSGSLHPYWSKGERAML